MTIEDRIVSITRTEETLYASTVGPGCMIYGPLRYETLEIGLNTKGLSDKKVADLREHLVERIVSDLNATCHEKAISKYAKEISYVGIANLCYIIRHPHVDVEKEELDAVAVYHLGTYSPTIKFRFRIPDEANFLTRLFRKSHPVESEFYTEVKKCLYSLVRDSKQVTLEAVAA